MRETEKNDRSARSQCFDGCTDRFCGARIIKDQVEQTVGDQPIQEPYPVGGVHKATESEL